MTELTTEVTDQIALILPIVATVFGALIGLVAVIAVGRFAVNRVRGGIK